MSMYEYKVVPAPSRGLKARGVKTPEARFANALETAINDLAADGWEYVRAETLPSEERQGLTGTATHFRNVLIFRRDLVEEIAPEDAPTALLEPPAEEADEPEVSQEPEAEHDPVDDAEPAAEDLGDEPDTSAHDDTAHNTDEEPRA